MYEPYATLTDYKAYVPEGQELNPDVVKAALRKASRHIDSLTYNRIVFRGFENLTQFQQEIVKEVCCRLAIFETEYDDMIGGLLNGYSINGVSVQMTAGVTVFAAYGIVMPKELYSLLIQTGLGCRMAR